MAKNLLCQKDTAETFLLSKKFCVIFKNSAGFVTTDEVLSHLLWIKSIKKEDLESPIKHYHPKHHNSRTENYASNMLTGAQNKRRKSQEYEKDKNSLSSPPTTTRCQSNASVMGELTCCF